MIMIKSSVKNSKSKQNSKTKSVSTKDGKIYTPDYIVDFMLENIIDKSAIDNQLTDTTILEPSCGNGQFIRGLFRFTEKHNVFQNKQEQYDWFINHVVAMDIDKVALNELKIFLVAYFDNEHHVFDNIICVYSLKYDFGNREFDYVIGNPPYIQAKDLSVETLHYLKNNFVSCKKHKCDIYYAFIEKFSKLSKHLIFVTSNSFLTNKSGDILLNQIKDNMSLLINFGSKKIFDNADVYSCIFKLDKNNNCKDEIYYGYENIDNISIQFKQNVVVLRDKIDINNNTIINVYSGIATLSDKTYTINIDDNSLNIENDIIVPIIKITKRETKYMIYPYNKSNHQIFSEDEMINKYPNCYQYLLNHREILLNRDKGKTDKYENWFAYGRKQGFHHLPNEIICIPTMIGGNSVPYKMNIQDYLEEYGKVLFVSGFVLADENNDRYLTDEFIKYVQEYGKAYSGNYYVINSKIIKGFSYE